MFELPTTTRRTRPCLRRSHARTLVALLLLFTPRAFAGPSSEDVAAAEALFRQGRALVDSGQVAAACDKFAESQRLDPAPGTLLNLGSCYEKLGKTASAWAAYREAASEARRLGQAPRAEDADALANELEPSLPRLTVIVPPESEVPGLAIAHDNRIVARAQWDVALPVDPGVHEVAASAPGRKRFVARVELNREARVQVVRVPPLEHAEPPPAPSSTQRAVGFVVGSAGLALLAGAGATSLYTLDLDSRARAAGCDDDTCWTDRGRALTVEARQWASVSTVLVVTGGIAIASSVVLLLTSPKRGGANDAAKALVRGSF